MSLREALSTNLSQLCKKEDSIASVCRATQINRQQFNRYLSGDSLPNQRNREKICRYFKIDEPDLFQERAVTIVKDRVDDDEDPWSHTDLRSVLKLIHSEVQTSIAPGLYFAHFAIPHDPKSVMRSTIVVRKDGNLSTFRRMTGFAEPKGSWWSLFNGDHKGVILERRHWLYFLAINALGNREPTLLVLRWLPSSRPMLGGEATILTPPGPTITAVVLTPCEPGMSLRTAIKSSHVYSAEAPEIDPMVLDTLYQQCQSLAAMTRRLDLSVKPI